MNFFLLCFLKAINVQVNPLYFMIPAAVGCSYAFMLPVSTPPNSIAFASGHLLVKDMVSKDNGRQEKAICLGHNVTVHVVKAGR